MIADDLLCGPEVKGELLFWRGGWVVVILNACRAGNVRPPDKCTYKCAVDQEEYDFPNDVVYLFDDESRWRVDYDASHSLDQCDLLKLQKLFENFISFTLNFDPLALFDHMHLLSK